MKAFVLIAVCCFAPLLAAQEIHIYSEFQRFDPSGNPVAPDRGLPPREILSPAMARNGHLSVHVVISAPTNTNYFLYAAANPADLVDITIYREYFVPCGISWCPDWLIRVPSPSFGAVPESSELAGETTRSYLLDIHAHRDVQPRRVRVEALLKVGAWQVAPMEIRIMAPTVPEIPLEQHDELAPIDAPASATAERQLLRYIGGLPPVMPEALLRLREITQRNAAEDMLLASSLTNRARLPELNLLSLQPIAYPSLSAEWYLRVRDFLHNFAQ